jgi:CubicO group peptidase (beta-lactamase class C family)
MLNSTLVDFYEWDIRKLIEEINLFKNNVKMKTTLALLLSMMICFQHASGQTTNAAKAVENSIDSLMEKKMSNIGIVGIGAAIIINKKLVWTKGYGYADRENKMPFTPLTIMNIASIAKTFTGVCIMKAVEQGKVSLDEDINTYLPFKVVNPNFPNEKITLRHLATHTSGITDRDPFYWDSVYFYGGAKPELLDVFLKNYFLPGGKHYSKANFLKSKPGTYRDYCNIGAGLAGYIVELRTGSKLNEYSKRYIFKPLKMTNSGWSLAEINTKNHTKLYEKKGDSIKQIQWYEETTYPDGGVRTSVDELSRFFIALLNDGKYNGSSILKKESVDEMLRFQFNDSNKPENVKPDKLNSGIFWATKMGGTRIGHNGTDPGVRTFMLSDLTKEIGIILFFNTSLSEKEENVYFDTYAEVYKHALGLTK